APSKPHLGSARVSRAGCRRLAATNFRSRAPAAKVRDREDAIASTRDAYATQSQANRAQRLINIFGRDRVYVEIQRHLVRGEERVNRQLIDLAEQHRLPLLATNGVQHATPLGRETLDVFTCIREHTHLDAAGTRLTINAERHLKSAAV